MNSTWTINCYNHIKREKVKEFRTTEMIPNIGDKILLQTNLCLVVYERVINIDLCIVNVSGQIEGIL